ncbi:MAG: serine hydrolase [Pseudomonadota bacterium]
MKKIVIGLLIVLLILFGGLWMLGLSPLSLQANLNVGLGITAKLGCSSRYVSGMDAAQAKADQLSYSPVLNLFELAYDDTTRTAIASAFGLETRARWRPGLGCALVFEQPSPLDNITIPSLPTPVGLWPRGPQMEPPNTQVQAVLDEIMQADNNAGQQTRVLLVAHQGRIVAESYADGTDVDTPLLGWSMGKSLMAMLLGQLQMQGELEVTDTQLFPQWQDERRQLTVEHLLQMSSGLDFSEVYLPPSDATEMLFDSYSTPAVALRSQLAHLPGTHFSYSSGTTNLLAQLLVDRVGGAQAAVDRFYRRFLGPLGMRHTILEPDASGVWVASSYIFASGRDWARLGQLMLNEGELNGQRIFTKAWAIASRQPNQSSNTPGYGYQFWLNRNGAQLRWPSLPEDTLAMMGNRQQRVMIVPSQQAVLVRLGWSPGSYPDDQNFAAMLAALPAN